VRSWLSNNLDTVVSGHDIVEYEETLPRECETPSVGTVYTVEDVDIEDVRSLPSGEVLVELEVGANCEINMFIFKADYYAMEEDEEITVWDEDWNEHYVAASKTMGVRIGLLMTFNPRRGEVTSTDVTRVVAT
jgi:hypothetical protein